MDQDPQVSELKEIVKRQGVVIDEMNKTLHGMRRSQRWHTFMRVAWWVLIFAVSTGFYYYYVQPYIDTIITAYQNAQHGVQQVQSFPQIISDIFKQFFAQFSGSATTTSH